MTRRLLAALAAGAILALTVVNAPSAAAAVGADPCVAAHPGWAGVGLPPDCEGSGTNPAPAQEQPAPAPTTAPAPAPTTAPAPAPAVADPTPAPAAPGPKPSTAAEEWAGEAAKGVAPAVKDVKDRYTNPPKLNLHIPIYSFTLMLGLIIWAVMLTRALTVASRGGPRHRADLWDSLPKLVFYLPLIAAAPGIVGWLYNGLAQPSAQVAASMSGSSFASFLDGLGAAFAANPLDLFGLLGSAIAALFVGFGTLLLLWTWLVIDVTAEFLAYLFTIALPVAAALALRPKWSRMAGKAINLLIGAMLTPFVVRLAFWGMWDYMDGQIREGGLFMQSITMLILFGISASAPMALSFLMPSLLPQGAGAHGNTGGSSRGHGRQALSSGGDAISRSIQAFRGGGGTPASASASRGATAGAGAAAGGGKAAGGAVAAGGAAAAIGGVVLAAGAAALAAGNAVASGGKSAAGQSFAASGGGMTSDHEAGTLPLPASRGRRPTSPAAVQARQPKTGTQPAVTRGNTPTPPRRSTP